MYNFGLLLALACANHHRVSDNAADTPTATASNKVNSLLIRLPNGEKLCTESAGDPRPQIGMRGKIVFPATPIGSETTEAITITNPWTTTAALIVQLEGPDFVAQPRSQIFVEPGATKEIIVTFRPKEDSAYMDNPNAVGTLTLIDTRASSVPVALSLIGAIEQRARSTE